MFGVEERPLGQGYGCNSFLARKAQVQRVHMSVFQPAPALVPNTTANLLTRYDNVLIQFDPIDTY